MKRAIVLAVAALTLAVSGAQAKGTTVTITRKDEGKTVTAAVGHALDVKLAGNPTTGYSWKLESFDKAVVEAAGDSYATEAGGENRMGAGGVFSFALKTVKPGETKLRFVYARPWEKVTPRKEDVFEVKVKVTE